MPMPHTEPRNDSPPDTPDHSASNMSVESDKGPLPRVATTVGTSTAFSSYSTLRDNKNTNTSAPTTVAFIDSHAFPTDNSSTAGFRSRGSLLESNPTSAFPSRVHSLVPDVSADYHHYTFGAPPNRLSIASSGILSPDAQSAPVMFGLGSQHYGFLATPMINNNTSQNLLGLGGSSSILGNRGHVSFAEEMSHIRSALITTFLVARAEGISREYSERYTDTHTQQHLTLSQQQHLGSSGDGNGMVSSEGAFGSGGSMTSAVGGAARITRARCGVHRHGGLPMGVVPVHTFIDDGEDTNVGDLIALGATATADNNNSKKEEVDNDDEDDNVADFSAFIPFMDPMEESSSAGTQAPPSSSINTQDGTHSSTNIDPHTNNVKETTSGTFEMSASDLFCPVGVMASSMDTTGHYHQHRTVDVLNIHSPLRSSLGFVGGGSSSGGMLLDIKPWCFEGNSMSTTGGLRSQSASVGNERFLEEQLMLPGMTGRTSSLSISITSRSVHGGGGRGGGHLDPLSPSSFSSGGKIIGGGVYSNFKAPFLGRRVIAKQLFIPVPPSYVSDLQQQQYSRSGSVSTNMSSSRASRTSWPFMDPAIRMRSRKSRLSLGNVPPAPKSIAHPSPPPLEFQDSLGNAWTRTEAVVGNGAYSTVYKGSQTNPTRSAPGNFSPHHVAILEESDSSKCAVAIKAVWLGFLTPAQVISVCNGEVMSMIVLSRGNNLSNRSSRSSAALSSSNHHNHHLPAQHTSHLTTTSSTTVHDSTTPHGEGSNGVASPVDDMTLAAAAHSMTAILPPTATTTHEIPPKEDDGGNADHTHSDGGGGASPGDHMMRSTTQGHDNMRSPSFSIGTSFGASMSTTTMGGSSGSSGAWSPYVLPLLGFSLAPETGYLLLVHPLLEGRSLASLISSNGQLPIAWIKILLTDVLQALVVLHASGITHRDVKPQNIFLRKRTPGRLEMMYGPANDPTTCTSSSTRVPGGRKPSVPNPLGVEMEWDEPSYCMLGDLGSALVDFRHRRASTSTRQSSHSFTTTTNGDVMSDGSIRETPIPAGGDTQGGGGGGVPLHPSAQTSTGLDMAGDALQGTPPYMSPEACCGNATSSSDVWSVGIMAFQMYTGRLPWRPTELAHPVLILQQHGKVDGFGPEWQDELAGDANFNKPIPSSNPSQLQSPIAYPTDSVVSVLECCLAVNPIQRWTATRLLTEHPFFTNPPQTILTD